MPALFFIFNFLFFAFLCVLSRLPSNLKLFLRTLFLGNFIFIFSCIFLTIIHQYLIITYIFNLFALCKSFSSYFSCWFRYTDQESFSSFSILPFSFFYFFWTSRTKPFLFRYLFKSCTIKMYYFKITMFTYKLILFPIVFSANIAKFRKLRAIIKFKSISYSQLSTFLNFNNLFNFVSFNTIKSMEFSDFNFTKWTYIMKFSPSNNTIHAKRVNAIWRFCSFTDPVKAYRTVMLIVVFLFLQLLRIKDFIFCWNIVLLFFIFSKMLLKVCKSLLLLFFLLFKLFFILRILFFYWLILIWIFFFLFLLIFKLLFSYLFKFLCNTTLLNLNLFFFNSLLIFHWSIY